MKKNKAIKWLLIIFGIVLLMRLITVWLFSPAPSAFSDEYSYIKIARSFFNSQTFSIHNLPFYKYPPLYSMLMSVAYWFNSPNGMQTIYFVMKIINAIVGAFIVFPAYLLSREFFKRKQSLMLALLIAFVPGIFITTLFVLSENLFYVLFLFAFYFTYKSFVRSEWRWSILAGIFIGGCLLTRLIMLPFLGAIGLMWLFSKNPRLSNIATPNKTYMFWGICRIFLIAFIVIAPWYIFGQGITGSSYLPSNYNPNIENMYDFKSLLAAITIPFVYIGYLMLASGIIPFFTIIPIEKLKGKKKYFWRFAFLTIACFIIFLGFRQMYNHGFTLSIFPWIRDRPIGRYISFLVPIAMLMGFINWNDKLNKFRASAKNLVVIGVATVASIYLFSFSLFPPNNPELTLIGAMKMILGNLLSNSGIDINVIFILIFLLIMSLGVAYILKELLLKEVVVILLIFFLITGWVGALAVDYNSTQNWYQGDAMRFGRWVNKNIPQNTDILIDEQACEGQINKLNQTLVCEKSGRWVGTPSTIMGVWMNNNLYIGSIKDLNDDYAYIITKQKLNESLLYKSFSGMRIYGI